MRTAAAIAAALAVLACRRMSPDMLLEYDGAVVLRSDFDAYVTEIETRSGPVDEGVRAGLLQTFIEERVLALEARRLGVLRPAASRAETESAVASLLASQTTTVDVSDAEIAADFEGHPAECRAPEIVTLRQILLRTESDAKDVRARLAKAPRDFDVVARARSVAPEAPQGGVMGRFERGQLPPEIESAAFSLGAGALSDVLASPLGFHVLRVDAHEAARDRSLAECGGAIRRRLFGRKADQKVREFVSGLVARAKVNS